MELWSYGVWEGVFRITPKMSQWSQPALKSHILINLIKHAFHLVFLHTIHPKHVAIHLNCIVCIISHFLLVFFRYERHSLSCCTAVLLSCCHAVLPSCCTAVLLFSCLMRLIMSNQRQFLVFHLQPTFFTFVWILTISDILCCLENKLLLHVHKYLSIHEGLSYIRSIHTQEPRCCQYKSMELVLVGVHLSVLLARRRACVEHVLL